MPLKKIDLTQSPKEWIKSQAKYHSAARLLRNQGYMSEDIFNQVCKNITTKTTRILDKLIMEVKDA